jgi:hypothetical protein
MPMPIDFGNSYSWSITISELFANQGDDRMRTFFAALTAIVVILTLPAASTIYSAERKVGGAIIDEADADYTNFEAEISSDTRMKFEEAAINIGDGPNILADTPVGGDNTTKVTIKWTGLTINRGDEIKGAWIVTQRERNQWTCDAYFTPRPKSTPLTSADIPALGLRVTPSGDVYLRNSRSFAIAYISLEFDFPIVCPTIDDLLADLEIPPTGTMSGVVPPGTRSTPGEVFVGNLTMQPGDFLTLKFDSEFDDPDQAGSTHAPTNILVHEHQEHFIPTLTEWGLIIFGVVLLGFITWVFLRRRKGVAVKA